MKQLSLFDAPKTTKRRSAKKETQQSMFNAQEMTGTGKALPMFGDYRPKMILIREDRRTNEQKQSDAITATKDKMQTMF